MDYSELAALVQKHVTDGLVLVIGSGLSAAEGIPGMVALAEHLSERASVLRGTDAVLWESIKVDIDAGKGLESSLVAHPPSDTLEVWIARETCDLLIPIECDIIGAVLRGERSLRLTTFLDRVVKPADGLPILTSNYDRLVEVACEMAGFHVDTTAVGHYAGMFDHTRSIMGSCRGIRTRGKTTVLDHFPRAIVLKPHGSFDWYQAGGEARRCSINLQAERLIITPGINKYRAGYSAPFDKHRDLANDYIERAGHLLVIGYGFNDDHLETRLLKQIKDGIPTLILNRHSSSKVTNLAEESPHCVCLSELTEGRGVKMVTQGKQSEYPGHELWDLDNLTKELLA